MIQDIADIARRTPAAPALSWHESTWTYRELDRAMRCVRDALASSLEPGSRVALLLRNSPQYAASYFGTLAAGCVAVPLNVQERANVLARQLEHSGCAALIVDPNHPEWLALQALCNEQSLVCFVIPPNSGQDALESFCAVMAAVHRSETHAPELAPHQLAPHQLAMIIYTSGTTGRPKGVMLSHGNLTANAHTIADYLGIVASDKVLCVLPFHFSYGASVLNSNLVRGAHIVLEDNFAFPQVALRRLQDERITAFAGVPSTFAMLLGRCRIADFDLSSLRYITQAGGAMPRAQIEQLRAALPHSRIFIMYGQTEATARLSYLAPELLETKLGSVGKPLPGVEIEIRGPGGDVLSSGEVGEICARGPNVMLGYWRDEQLTKQVLQDGWLHTGDLGHRDPDGFLYIDGRAVEMIKVGAFRVSPQEVEEVLAAHPDVQEVAVTATPDEVLGQAVKAVIVLRAGHEPDLLSVKAHCRQNLATYKIPKIVEFAAVLPRTSSGKVQRYKLA